MLNEVLFQVFAMECIQKVMSACEATGDGAHFDLVKAKEKMMTDPNGMYAGFLSTRNLYIFKAFLYLTGLSLFFVRVALVFCDTY